MHPTPLSATSSGTDESFTRRTVKYIVNASYLPTLKHALEHNIGVSPFIFPDGHAVSSQTVHSVYLDNPDLAQYHERVVKTDHAKLFRVRWYGDSLGSSDSSVFMERKNHRDDVAKAKGMESVKERFEVPVSRVVEFMEGSWSCGGEEVNNLVRDTQDMIVDRKLGPCLQTVYKRTSYQSPKNKDLRITVDEDVCIYEEPRGWESIITSDGRSVGQPLHTGCAILEIKVKTEDGENVQSSFPHWLLSHLAVDKVAKIRVSKFNFGCVSLYPDQCYVNPEWLFDVRHFGAGNLLAMKKPVKKRNHNKPHGTKTNKELIFQVNCSTATPSRRRSECLPTIIENINLSRRRSECLPTIIENINLSRRRSECNALPTIIGNVNQSRRRSECSALPTFFGNISQGNSSHRSFLPWLEKALV